MGTESIKITELIPASADRLYAAWLDSTEHGKMSGGPAEVDPRVGGRHRSWGDYIWGETLELEPGKRIVQSWRTAEFPADAGDSRIAISFEGEGEHARMTIEHTDIPEGDSVKYMDGWENFYIRPMLKYFGGAAKKAAPKKAVAKKAAPKKAVAKKAAPKKAVAKKAAPKKAAPKKAAPKKAAPKKAVAKKAAPKKAAPKKAVAKKAAPKKA